MKPTFSFFFLVWLIGACHEPSVQAPRYRLKKTTTILINSSSPQVRNFTYTNYTYNASDQLVSIRNSTGQFWDNTSTMYPSDSYALTYNDAGLLIQSEWHQDPNSPASLLNFYRRYLYTYDSQNRLTEVNAYKVVLDKPKVDFEERYAYGTARIPATGIRKNYLADGTLLSEITANYSFVSDNVASVTYNTTGYTDSYTRNYQYDDHPNPSYGVIISGGYSVSILSKNNLLESEQAYTYNDQGLPSKKTWSTSDGSGELQYEYETY